MDFRNRMVANIQQAQLAKRLQLRKDMYWRERDGFVDTNVEKVPLAERTKLQEDWDRRHDGFIDTVEENILNR